MPNASACFLAFSRRSAMLEFLLWAAAMAAILRGYDEDNRKSSVLLVRPELDPITTAPVIAAAYYKDKKKLFWAGKLENPGKCFVSETPPQTEKQINKNELLAAIPRKKAERGNCGLERTPSPETCQLPLANAAEKLRVVMSCQQAAELPDDPYTFTEPPATTIFTTP
uniref:Uncharacterized protein n=1 Tax=Phlebotomus papatasi TaxID=29031 RepID=A0A1B0F0D2_PHLPP